MTRSRMLQMPWMKCYRGSLAAGGTGYGGNNKLWRRRVDDALCFSSSL